MDIFKLVGSVFVDTEEANKSLQKTDDKASSVGSTLVNGAKSAGKFAAGLATAAAGAVTALVSVAKSTASTADEIDKMSQRLGLSTDSYQELDFVLSQSGVDINSFQTGMKTLVANMDKVTEGNKTAIANFAKLGIEVQNADGSLRDEETVLFEAISAFQAMEDSTEKTRLAQELFGKQGQEIIPLLNAESGSLEQMRQEAHDLGLVMSEEAVASGVSFTDTMDKLTRSFSAIGNQVGAAVLPLVEEFANMLIAFMPTIMQIVDQIMPVIVDLLNVLMPIFTDLVMQLLPPTLKLIEALLPLFTMLCDLILPPLTKLLVYIVNIIADYVIPAITKVVEIVKKIIQEAPQKFQDFKNKILDVFEAIKAGIKAPINGIIGMINKMIEALNSLKFDVPDWVPVLGGKSFGFNLKTIPLLAKGGNVTEGGQAIVGEAGAEMIDLPAGATVTPLTSAQKQIIDYDLLAEKVSESMITALRDILPELQYAIEPDGNGIFNVVRSENLKFKKSTGRSAFA